MAENKIKLVDAKEIELVQGTFKSGAAYEPKVEEPAAEPAKAEPPKIEPPKVEAPKPDAALNALTAKKVTPVEPPKAEVPKAEPPKETPKDTPKPDVFTISEAYIEEAKKELEAFKATIGTGWAELEGKVEKIIASENFDKLVKGGFTPKQAITQIGLMAQGFVNPDEKAAMAKKVQEIKDAAAITPAPPAPAPEPENPDVLVKRGLKEIKHGYSESLAKAMNDEEDIKLINSFRNR